MPSNTGAANIISVMEQVIQIYNHAASRPLVWFPMSTGFLGPGDYEALLGNFNYLRLLTSPRR